MSEPHTPAPWSIREGFLIDGPGFIALASVRAGGIDRHSSASANARLIATAPDLFAFVEAEARRDPLYAKGPHNKQRIEDAKALVAKVRGAS